MAVCVFATWTYDVYANALQSRDPLQSHKSPKLAENFAASLASFQIINFHLVRKRSSCYSMSDEDGLQSIAAEKETESRENEIGLG
jgi:hypothetical protein